MKLLMTFLKRYVELFNLITGRSFQPRKSDNILKELEANITEFLSI